MYGKRSSFTHVYYLDGRTERVRPRVRGL